MICTNCGCDAGSGGWHLRNYFHITGNFCRDCYEKVAHDSYGQPVNPGEYYIILLRQQGKFS
jgi:hypothetical protein